MSSDIFEEDGGLIAGSQAWHGAFDLVDDNFNREIALAHPNVGFEVIKVPMIAQVPSDNMGEMPSAISVPDNFAIVRTDTKRVLGVVGGQYVTHQPSLCFDFGDMIAKEAEAKYTCVFSLRHGRTIGALIHLADSGISLPNDRSEAYAYVTTSFDGKTPTMAILTYIRVLCGNTERFALRSADQIIKIRHSGNTESKVRAASDALMTFGAQAVEAQELASELNASAPTPDQVKTIIERMFPTPDDKASDSAKTRHGKRIELLGMGIDAEIKLLADPNQATNWTLYQGFTRYTDHIMPIQERGRDSGEVRIESAFTPAGRGSKIKAEALNVIVDSMRA